MMVEPLRLVFTQPAPAIVFKSTKEITLATQQPQSAEMLNMIDEKASDKLNPDALDGYYGKTLCVSLCLPLCLPLCVCPCACPCVCGLC